MEVERDIVRQAVLASLHTEKRIQNGDVGDTNATAESDGRAPTPHLKRRKFRRKGQENWKKLQKSISADTKHSKVIRKSNAIKRKRVDQPEERTDKAKFSSFMKREVRCTASPTKVVAMDCEMVGVGKDGKQNALARVSVVNYAGDVLYDSFVKVHERVSDYRTQWSGIRPEDVSPDSDKAVEPFEAQHAVGEIFKGRIVVGHAIKNDMRVLRISHPWRDIRDTSDFYKKLWRSQGRRGGRGPALRIVVAQVLGVDSFQKEEHDSCEDARAALALYKRHAKEWENSLKQKKGRDKASRRKHESTDEEDT